MEIHGCLDCSKDLQSLVLGTPCKVELLFLEGCTPPSGRFSVFLLFTMGEGRCSASGTSPSMKEDLYNILCSVFAFGESKAAERDLSTSSCVHYNFDRGDGEHMVEGLLT